MRLLIIGAGGFLGSHVRRQASAAGLTIITASRFALPGSPSHQRLDLSADGPETIAAVIGSAAPDAVINCAGATTGAPEVLAAANITGTHALATAMLRANAPARLVHLGSAAEYGPSEPGVPVTESAPARPAGAYGLTKLAGTLLVETARMAGLDAVALRVFNPVGRGAPENGLPGSLAAQLRRAQADGTEVRLGPLDAVRDFVDARDVADAALAAAMAPALPHGVLNVGSGRGVPARTLVKELLAISACDTGMHEDGAGSPRSEGRSWQQADISRTCRDLGWRPCRDLTASLSDLWEAGDGRGTG